MTVTRTLPNRGRRMVGAWCFVDYYGPDDVTDSPGMQVAPHPHAGLQTVSWLVEGWCCTATASAACSWCGRASST